MVRRGHLIGRFGRGRSWRRRAMVSCLLLVALLVGAYLYVANPKRLSRIAAEVLTQLTGAEVHIGSAHVALDGSIELRDVRLRVPGLSDAEAEAAGRLFEAEQVRVEHRLGALLIGRFEVTSLVLFNPWLYITEEADTGRYTYQRLRLAQTPDAEMTKLPELFVRQGCAQFGELGPGGYAAKGAVRLDGKLTEYPGEPGQYFFALRQDAEGGGGTTLNGRFNPRQLTVTAELERFSFEGPYGHLLPRRFRLWWDRLDPAGSLPAFRVSYNPDPKLGLRAVIEVRDVELSLPYVQTAVGDDAAEDPDAAPAAEAAREHRVPRMTHVSGRFTLENEVVRVEDLSGRLEGIEYHIDGRIDGLGPDAPFQFAVRTEPFEVPEEPPYFYVLPPAAQRQFRRLSPGGRFVADVALARRSVGGRVEYDGTLTLDGAHLTYWKFPYRVSDLHGRIHFNDQAVTIEDLRGVGPSGAEIQISGETSQPGEGAAVHLLIRVAGMPIDGYLLRAMEDKPRRVVEMLMDGPQYQRLLDEGLVRRPDAAAADAIFGAAEPAPGSRPAFAMGGRMDMVVQVQREFGPDKEYRNTVRIDAAGLAGVFKHWPYPLRAQSGSVTITDDSVAVDHVVVRGVTGGRGIVNGSVTKVLDPVKRWVPDLHVTDAVLPLDACLLASVPRPQDRWVRQLQLSGELAARAHIFEPADAIGDIDFRITTRLNGGGAEPFGGGFALDQVSGEAVITHQAVELHDFAGRHGEATLSLGGDVRWGDAGPAVDVRFHGVNVPIQRETLGLLPPWFDGRDRLAAMLGQYQPTGRFSLDLNYAAVDGRVQALKLDLQPHELAFDLHGQRINLRDIRGNIVLDGDAVEFQQVHARFGSAGGEASLEGLVTLGADGGMALRFDAWADRFDDATRAVVPAAALRAIDGLELRGGYHLQGGRFLKRSASGPVDGDGNPSVAGGSEFEGRITLKNAIASVGVPITDLDGDLYVRTTQAAGAAWPTMNVRLDAASLRAADRLIAPLAVELTSDPEQPDVLRLGRVRGVCYGGALVGEGEVHLAQRGRYRLALTLHDAALDPLLEPLKFAAGAAADAASQASTSDGPASSSPSSFSSSVSPPAPGPSAPVQVPLDPRVSRERGLLSARIDLEALPGVAASRRGRGAIDVRNASLYQLPLALAALQIANLSWPVAESFDRAAARFLIDGDLIRFDQIRFESPNVEIVGDGTMRFADRRLDLNLFSRNPAAWDLGAVSDLINVFKDEIVRIEVAGTLDAPRPRVASFLGISRTVGQIFGDRTQRLTPRRGDAIVGGSDAAGPIDPQASP